MAFQVDDSLYDSIDPTITVNAESWDDLRRQIRDDLAAWLNCEPDQEDKIRLLKLYTEGRFKAWYCPHCGGEATRVYKADVEGDEWDHFQGALNQDFSFFGDRDRYAPEYIKAMCDSCRCHG